MADDEDKAAYDAMPVTQQLVIDNLAARHRLGERTWTFSSKATQAVRRLEELGLVWWKSGIVERTILVGLTPRGQEFALSDDYVPPAWGG